jgi:hypothetical protein
VSTGAWGWGWGRCGTHACIEPNPLGNVVDSGRGRDSAGGCRVWFWFWFWLAEGSASTSRSVNVLPVRERGARDGSCDAARCRPVPVSGPVRRAMNLHSAPSHMQCDTVSPSPVHIPPISKSKRGRDVGRGRMGLHHATEQQWASACPDCDSGVQQQRSSECTA